MSATRTPETQSSATDASATIPSTLDDAAKDAVRDRLQPLLVDLIDLSLTGKQLHWIVVGRNFVPVHEQLDELVDQYRAWSDDVAERLTSIGVVPDGRLQRVASDTPSDAAPEGWTDDAEVVRVMAERIEAVARRTRVRLEGLGDLDVASEDLLIGILDGLEKQLWMVAAQTA